MTPAQRRYWINNQIEWIKSCGGDLAGYIRKYGWPRAMAIYEADIVALAELQRRA